MEQRRGGGLPPHPAREAGAMISVNTMSRFGIVLILALGVGMGAAGGYWYAQRSPVAPVHADIASPPAASQRPVLYYRDPGGAPFWSSGPKKDQQGRDYLPVYDDEEPSFDAVRPKAQAANGARRILHYRNPMGLPDTSPIPKKDPMGMDYIPVFESDEPGDTTVKISLDRVQRSGVRSEPAQKRVLVQPVRGVGAVAIDERKLTTVTLRSEGYIEDLFVNTTGQMVRAGEPLFRVYSSQIQQAQTDLLVAMGAMQRGVVGADAERSLSGAMQRMRNLGVPESRIEEVRKTGTNPRTLDWPAPANGSVISKRIINGQRVAAGDELYRIADLSTVWVIADVAEADVAMVKPGTRALVTFRAYPAQPVEGRVTLIYPEVRSETRTARVRIELPNPDGRLKSDMYADVVFRIGADETPVVTIPHSAVIDSGAQQIVLVARGEGRFEPRAVKIGRRGNGYCEVLDGIREGEEIVTTATFLIDAESNLRAALKTFSPETPVHREDSR
jgi:Cu(I)/Ag(I) efflux system membrane fusion protein